MQIGRGIPHDIFGLDDIALLTRISGDLVGIRGRMTNEKDMQDRLDVEALGKIDGDDQRLAQFLPAFLAALERFAAQLERKDRILENKEERLRGLDHEIVQLRAAIAKLQRNNEETRRTFNAAQVERQHTIDRLQEEIEKLRAMLDHSQELHRVGIVRSNQIEIANTRAQIAQVDTMIAQIQRSFFWRLKTRISNLRAAVRR